MAGVFYDPRLSEIRARMHVLNTMHMALSCALIIAEMPAAQPDLLNHIDRLAVELDALKQEVELWPN